MPKDEMDELYSYESAICGIKFNLCLNNGQIIECSGHNWIICSKYIFWFEIC